jgi:hypothetical protein
MAEEEDIGLYSLAGRRSDSSTETPRKRNPRRPSIVTILREEERTPIKSPSSHNLVLPPSPRVTPRKLSRSNTLPKLSRMESSASGDDLGSMSMNPYKVHGMRRWILAIIIGMFQFMTRLKCIDTATHLVDFDLDYGPKITGMYPALDLTGPEAENMCVASVLTKVKYSYI